MIIKKLFIVLVVLLSVFSSVYADKIELINPQKINIDDTKDISMHDKFVMKADKNGDVYFLDRKSCQVYVLDKQGNYKATLGRKGQGPGEFVFPINMVIKEKQIYVFEVMPFQRISKFDKKSYKFIKTQNIDDLKDNKIKDVMEINNGKNLLFTTFKLNKKMEIIVGLMLADNEFKSIKTICKNLPTSIYNKDKVGINFCYDIKNNHIYSAPFSDNYDIFCYNLEGKQLKKITKKDFKPIKKAPEVLKEEKAKRDKRKGSGLPKYAKNTYKNGIKQIVCDNKSRLWVLTPCEDSNKYNLDIFNEKGELLQTINLKDFNLPEISIVNDNLYVLEREDDGGNRYYIRYDIKT